MDKLILGGSSSLAANNGFGIDAWQSLDLGYIGAGDVVWAGRGGGALKRTLIAMSAGAFRGLAGRPAK